MGRSSQKHLQAQEASGEHNLGKSEEQPTVPLGRVLLNGSFAGKIRTPTHLLDVCVPLNFEVPSVALEPALDAFLQAAKAAGEHGHPDEPMMPKLHGHAEHLVPINPAKLWHDLIALCRTHEHHEHQTLQPELKRVLCQKFNTNIDDIEERFKHLEDIEDKLEQLQDAEAALEVDNEAKAARLAKVLKELDDLQCECDELKMERDALRHELEAVRKAHHEVGLSFLHVPVFKKEKKNGKKKKNEDSEPEVIPEPETRPEAGLQQARDTPSAQQPHLVDIPSTHQPHVIAFAADEGAGPFQDATLLSVEGHPEAEVLTRARMLSVGGPKQGREPGQQPLDVVCGLSSEEAYVGTEGSGGKNMPALEHAVVWERFSDELAADLDDALPTVFSASQMQDPRDMKKRHLENSKQCSSVPTQTHKMYEAGCHPKPSQQCLSATTQTDFLPSLARTQTLPTQTHKMYEAGSHPKPSQQCLSATTQTDVLPSLARTQTEVFLPSVARTQTDFLPSLGRTQSERHSFGNKLQGPISDIGAVMDKHVKTVAQHLEQLKMDRQSALSARTPRVRFQHCSMTGVCAAVEAVTSPIKEVHEKAFKVSAEAGSIGRNGFFLGPDWPRSRQLTLSSPVVRRRSQ